MGSGSSIAAENLPDDLKALVDVIEGQKNRIAEHDALMLEKEVNKMFKGHNVIIDELTGRSKPQIRRMLEKFPNALKHLDALVESGNSYAKFIKQLATPKDQIELDMSTRNDTEYDEEMLVDIIGTSSIREIKSFNERFSKLKSYSLIDVFTAHGKKDSMLLKFVQRILRLDRDESKNVDKDLAQKQAEIIHKSGAARLIGVDEDPIIEIFASSSRNQCACIAECYVENYNMKLERAINMKFKGNCGKLMVLWTETVPNAILSVIGFLTGKMLVDTSLIAQFIAKYDKDTLSSVDEVCMVAHKKPLAEFINHGILTSSTLQRACKGWIELPSPDKGFEKILQLFIDSKFPDGKIDFDGRNRSLSVETPNTARRQSVEAPNTGRKQSSADLMLSPKKDDLQQKFKFLLEKQAQEIKLFMIDRKIKIDPNDQFVLSRASTQTSSQTGNNTARSNTEGAVRNSSTIASFSARQKKLNEDGGNDFTEVEEEDDPDALSPLPSPRRQYPSRTSANEKPTVAPAGRKTVFETNIKSFAHHKSAEQKEKESKEVYNYLVQFFEKKDTESDGSFDGSVFWRLARSLPLDTLGLTEDDIDTIRQYCSWENEDDGRVYYYESLFEFTESIITAIDNKPSGQNNVLAVIQELNEEAQGNSRLSPTREIVKLSAKRDKFANPILSRQTSNMSMSAPASALASPRFAESFVLSEKRKEFAVLKFPKIPFYLREYIMDTLTCFDFDVNGTLCRTELENLVPALNIPTLTVDEFFENSQNQDKVNPKEAADIISKHVHDYFGDEQDHYICLVDKNSGAYFWYNTRDESTQWADTTYNEGTTVVSPRAATGAGIAFAAADTIDQEEMKELPELTTPKTGSKNNLLPSDGKSKSSVSLTAEAKDSVSSNSRPASAKEAVRASSRPASAKDVESSTSLKKSNSAGVPVISKEDEKGNDNNTAFSQKIKKELSVKLEISKSSPALTTTEPPSLDLSASAE